MVILIAGSVSDFFRYFAHRHKMCIRDSCGVLYDWVMKFNGEAKAAGTMRPFHKLRPIPQNHIDRLKPAGKIEEEQNEGYY